MDNTFLNLETKNQCQAEEVRKLTKTSLWINLALSILKFAGGLLGKSQAVLADAVHTLSDTSTDLAILIGVRYWNKPADSTHPHGHRRLEIMVTLGIGIVLMSVATAIIWNAIITIKEAHSAPPEWIAFVAALISIISKELLYRWTVTAGRRIKSMSVIANAWHQRSDALSSIPVVVAVAAAIITPDWSFLDHLGAIAVSLFIYQASFKITCPAFNMLIDSGSKQEELEKIRHIAMKVDGVEGVHKIRTRYVGSANLSVDLHIEVDPNMSVCNGHEISGMVKNQLLAEGSEVVDVVVHLEPSPMI